MLHPVDVDAYLARIGSPGRPAATLDGLAGLHALHPAAIPFENLDPLLGRPVRLDAAALQQKLVHEGRGGYCYEQNLLFAGVLSALGFAVTGLAARVLWNAPADAVRPRSHMLLCVAVGGTRYLADVGFGGLTLTAPLRFEPHVEQPTPHEPFRIVPAAGDFLLQALVRGAWKSLYRFGTEEHLLPDYEVANWYTSTSPQSIFLTSLMAARVVPGCRFALLNNDLAIHTPDGATERRTLESGGAIATALEDLFGVRLPDDSRLRPALDRLTLRSAI
jgi:N-hydroxyarylamine O-acetyltransferase